MVEADICIGFRVNLFPDAGAFGKDANSNVLQIVNADYKTKYSFFIKISMNTFL